MPYIIEGVDYSAEVALARQRVFDPLADKVSENLIGSLFNDVLNLSFELGGATLHGPGTVFLENITSTIHTVSLLYNTLFGNVLMDMYGDLKKKRQNEMTANLNRPLTSEEEASIERQTLEHLEQPDQIETAKIWTLRRVNLIWQRDIIAMSGPQVLRQGSVLLWGAFEVLSTDLLIVAADSRSALLARVLASDALRQKCKIAAPDWHDTTLWPQNREKIKLNSLDSISIAYQALLPAVGTALSRGHLRFAWFADAQLNMLGQRRHAIVHRGGIKDAEYLSKSGDAGNVEDPISVTPDDFRDYVQTVIRIGMQMLQAVDAAL